MGEGSDTHPPAVKTFRDTARGVWRTATTPFRWVGSGFKTVHGFFRNHKIIAWSIPAVSIGLNMLRGAVIAHNLEQDRLALAVTPSDDTIAALMTSAHIMGTEQPDSSATLTWEEDLKLLQQFAHDERIVDATVRCMFANVFTPDGAQILAHRIAETLLVSHSASPEQKTAALVIVEREYNEALKRFQFSFVTEAVRLGYVGMPEQEYPIDTNGDGAPDVTIRGHLHTVEADKFYAAVETRLTQEKSALQSLTVAHNAWVAAELSPNHPEWQQPLGDRTVWLDAFYPVTWKDLESRIAKDRFGLYEQNAKTAFVAMQSDFAVRNPTYWDAYRNDTPGMERTAWGWAGMFSYPFFAGGHWVLAFVGIPYFGAGGNAISAPGNARDIYLTYEPLPLTIADYGLGTENVGQAGQLP